MDILSGKFKIGDLIKVTLNKDRLEFNAVVVGEVIES